MYSHAWRARGGECACVGGELALARGARVAEGHHMQWRVGSL